MLIDETCLLCPFSLKKEKVKKKCPKKWIITDDGLAQFHKITGEEDADYEKIGDDSYPYLESYIEECMDKCFKVARPHKHKGKENNSSKKFGCVVKGLMKLYKQGKHKEGW